MRTLVEVLEFNGDDEVMPGTSSLKPGAINSQKDVELVIEPEEYEGKSRLRVKWVNNLNRGFESLSPDVVKTELRSLGFKAAFLAAKPTKKTEAEIPF